MKTKIIAATLALPMAALALLARETPVPAQADKKDATVDQLPWNLSAMEFNALVDKCGDLSPEAALRNLFILYKTTDAETSERVADEIETIREKIGRREFLGIVKKQPFSTRQEVLMFYEDLIEP